MKMNLNFKNMVETYKRTNASSTTWISFHTMYALGFIEYALWNKFIGECKHWEYDLKNDRIINTDTGEEVA